MSVLNVYGIEEELEAAITALFNSTLTVFTTQDDPQFQKDRSRLEVEVILGAGKQKHLALSETTGLLCDVEDAWEVTIKCAVLTPANKGVHAAYRTQTRLIMAQLPALINTGIAPGLIDHMLHGPMHHVGSSPIIVPEKGYWQTQMNYSAVVSVHQNAWSKLNT